MPMNSSHEYGACGGGSGVSGKYRPGSPTTCVLLGATWHELQSSVQVAATCAGLGGAQERPNCKPRPTAASAGPGGTGREGWGMPSPDAACLRDFRESEA